MRNALLIIFMLLCTGVIGLNHYIVQKDREILWEGFAYNNREMARNKMVSDAQIYADRWAQIASVQAGQVNALTQQAAKDKELLDHRIQLINENHTLGVALEAQRFYIGILVNKLKESGIAVPKFSSPTATKT